MELGFIGLGQMGRRMAIRLLDAGHSLTVFDRDEAAIKPLVERGARRAASAAEVAAASEAVLMSLPTPDIVRDVVLGPDGVTASNRTTMLVDLSNTGPRMATTIAAELDKAGRITLIDAPVSGGAGRGITANRAIDIQQPAIAGITVGQERKTGCTCNAAYTLKHLAEGCGAGIGHTERRGDDAIPGHVKRVEAGTCRHSRRDAVKNARKRQTSIALQQRTKRSCSRQTVLPLLPQRRLLKTTCPLFFSRLVLID